MSNEKPSAAATKKLQQITVRLRKALEIVNIPQVKTELKNAKSIKLKNVSAMVAEEFTRLSEIAKSIL